MMCFIVGAAFARMVSLPRDQLFTYTGWQKGGGSLTSVDSQSVARIELVFGEEGIQIDRKYKARAASVPEYLHTSAAGAVMIIVNIHHNPVDLLTR